ncbi:hypothetical protein VNI00_018612 [Paramarasmius palmivorus]|uniref:Uncharacterized protein n=1 Tax=Paramarasmius palmivorus TaxID=297713 RepID=A0AAW0AZ61_9AGAR
MFVHFGTHLANINPYQLEDYDHMYLEHWIPQPHIRLPLLPESFADQLGCQWTAILQPQHHGDESQVNQAWNSSVVRASIDFHINVPWAAGYAGPAKEWRGPLYGPILVIKHLLRPERFFDPLVTERFFKLDTMHMLYMDTDPIIPHMNESLSCYFSQPK